LTNRNLQPLKLAIEMHDLRRKTVKTQLTSAIRHLFTFVYALLSNPQTVRVAVTIIVVCFALAALCVPVLSALADGLSGGGH
jgi:hypothetical protein